MEQVTRTISILPLTSVLTVIFVIFKLLGKLDWSWWWVFSPLWIPYAIVIGVTLVVLLVAGIVSLGLFFLDSRQKF